MNANGNGNGKEKEKMWVLEMEMGRLVDKNSWYRGHRGTGFEYGPGYG